MTTLAWQWASMLSMTVSRASRDRRWVVYNWPDTGKAFFRQKGSFHQERQTLAHRHERRLWMCMNSSRNTADRGLCGCFPLSISYKKNLSNRIYSVRL